MSFIKLLLDRFKRKKPVTKDTESDGQWPPMLEELTPEGEITWRHLKQLDVRTMGMVLSCHLILEHYIDSFLAHASSNYLNWDKVNLSFSHKINLLSGEESPLEKEGFANGFRCLNRIRNKFAHSLEFALSTDDVAPMRAFTKKRLDKKIADDLSPEEVVQEFTGSACAWIAGYLSATAASRRASDDNDPN